MIADPRLLALMPLAALSAQAEEDIVLPSGLAVSLIEVIQDTQGAAGLTARFRFLAPGIARAKGAMDVEGLIADMTHLCQTYALPRIANIGPQPSQVVISLSDRPVPFGQPDAEATQFFEAFSRDGETCVWEEF